MRTTWMTLCSQNAHDRNVLAWGGGASRRLGWAGVIVTQWDHHRSFSSC
jgi:hypothetical protein